MHQRQEHLTFFAVLLFISAFVGVGITILPFNIPFITALCILLFFVGFFNTNWAFVLLIIGMLLSPEFVIAKVPGRDVIIRLEDFLVIVFFLSWIARIAVLKRQRIVTETPLNKYIMFYSAVFTLVTLRGIMLGYVTSIKGIFYVLKYFEYFLIYFFVCNVFSKKSQAKIYLKAFFFTFVIVNIYAISQIGAVGRVSAPFEGSGEPNTLGGYLVLIQGVILGIIIHLNSFRKRLILSCIVIFSLVTLTYTLSRSSYLAFIPMYLTIVFVNRTKRKNIFIAAMIIAIVLGMFFFPQNVKERLQYTFIPQVQETIEPVAVGSLTLGPSASARIRSWIHFFEMWKRHPLLGFGLTGLGFIDSEYVRVLAESGLLGLVAFVGLLGGIYRNTLRIYKNAQDKILKGLALGFLAGHVGMVVHALTANTYIIIRIMEPYWFLTAMVMMIPKIDDKPIEVEAANKTEVIGYPRASKIFLNSNKLSL